MGGEAAGRPWHRRGHYRPRRPVRAALTARPARGLSRILHGTLGEGHVTQCGIRKGFSMTKISSPERFSRICSDLAREFGGPQPAATCSLHHPTVLDIEVEGIPFSVIYAPVERPDQLAVVCRLGTLPPVDQAPVLRRLLELSFF